MHKNKKTIEKVLGLAKAHKIIRVRDLTQRGIHPEYLRRLCEKGTLEKISRGIYILSGSDLSQNIGLAQIAKRIPHGVICLLSSLQFYEIGTQSPFEVWVAIDRKSARPQIDYPPVRIVRFTGSALTEGIEKHRVEGVEVKIFNRAKTIADCFKYRNKIGLDVALEALKECRRHKLCTNDQLWEYAKICRVAHIMRPYLEATL